MNDMYPHDSSYYQIETPVEQVVEAKKTEGKVRAGMAIIEDIIARLVERVEFYDTLSSIPDEVIADPNELAVYVAGNKLTKRNLQQELDWLISLRDQYKR